MITFEDVSFHYEGSTESALRHINLKLQDHEMIAIVGHNGSGKSTLAKHINGLLVPSSGSVKINQLDTSREEDLLSIRQEVGIVFQNPDNQLVTTIVEEDVAFGPENLGIPSDEIRKLVDSSLLSVDMEDYKTHSCYNLSGGQKQRIAIAGMLSMKPNVLVLDEATAMLDPKGRHEILDIVTKLNHEQKLTIIMITQYMEEAIPCDRVIVMNHGSVCMDGTPKEIFSREKELKKIGLCVPEPVWLSNQLKGHGIMLSDTPLTIQETAEEIWQLYSKK